MKHKAWLRLVLKIVGLCLLALGATDLVNVGTIAFSNVMGLTPWGGGSGGFNVQQTVAVFLQWGGIGAAVKALLGLCLLLGAGGVANLLIPSNRPYCPDCGHELAGLSGIHCPECGSRLPADVLAHVREREAPAQEAQGTSELSAASAAPADSAEAPTRGLRRLIPADNRRALIAYYLAVASLIPVLGLFIGPVAVAYGVEALRLARRNTRHSGRVHGWAAVVLGSLATAANACGLCILLPLVSMN